MRAALVADGGPTVFDRDVAVVEMGAGQVYLSMIQAQDTQSEVFLGTLLAPLIKVTVAALLCQGVGWQQQGAHRQPAPLTAGFELEQDSPDDSRQPRPDV